MTCDDGRKEDMVPGATTGVVGKEIDGATVGVVVGEMDVRKEEFIPGGLREEGGACDWLLS